MLLFELFVTGVLICYVVCCLACVFWLCILWLVGVFVALRWSRVGIAVVFALRVDVGDCLWIIVYLVR